MVISCPQLEPSDEVHGCLVARGARQASTELVTTARRGNLDAAELALALASPAVEASLSGLALVTGASRGLGRAVALGLARRGLSQALLGRASPAHTETASLVRQAGGQALELFANFSDALTLTRAAERLLSGLGPPSRSRRKTRKCATSSVKGAPGEGNFLQ